MGFTVYSSPRSRTVRIHRDRCAIFEGYGHGFDVRVKYEHTDTYQAALALAEERKRFAGARRVWNCRMCLPDSN